MHSMLLLPFSFFLSRFINILPYASYKSENLKSHILPNARVFRNDTYTVGSGRLSYFRYGGRNVVTFKTDNG
jgi:hypothetical protein